LVANGKKNARIRGAGWASREGRERGLQKQLRRTASKLNVENSWRQKSKSKNIDKSEFRVRVTESGSETSHDVTVSPKDYTRLTIGKVGAEELVRRSFEFLLEREPKESILTRFDLSVISRYFPEYESEIRRRLS
jgi:hypothetical protein